MRPIRRGERIDVEQARRVVSEAEQQALVRADQLRQEAENLLRVVTTAAAQTPAVLAGSDTGAGEVADHQDLRADFETLRADHDALRADHQALRARVDGLERAANPGETSDRTGRLDELDRPDADINLLAGAVREAEELLSAAMSAIASETARAQDAREEAERIRDQARADAERIRDDARRQSEAGAQADLADARRRFADETAELRGVMERTWTSLDRLLGPGPANSAG